MAAPERIHINWNASDGWDTFNEVGVTDTHRNPPTPEQIARVLGSQAGKLFQIEGWTDAPRADVRLSIRDEDNGILVLANKNQPAFEAAYTIASEPLPYVTLHGDYIFDLLRADS